ncbi:hypothetical protein QIS99_08625 [Streptomyces sp. B-S-A8]|uniref:Uncharacterized protein n=1 Tax=Streptomyces solicavernae TaxID=3043614 RepID=A0ABT6RPB4_9ACTN|nr:hypothetical protein [Streptomyces sp. B-S-A8]MDI3386279.1 hypothetical protein [Streptomyces sp. B-S-A8]
MGAFSENAREVLEKCEFAQQIKRLDSSDLLYKGSGSSRTGSRRTARARSSLMDHVSTVDSLGKRYFGADQSFKSNLDRSARRAAWRMIRRETGLAEGE